MKVFNMFITAVCVICLIKLPWPKTKSLYDLETNLHRLSSPVNILIFVKSNSKLHFFGLLSRSVPTLIINISSSKAPTNTMDIHSVRNVCKLVIIFHLS